MSSNTKKELENMLFEIVDFLDLDDASCEFHGQFGTTPVDLVKKVLEDKDKIIYMLKHNMKCIDGNNKKKCNQCGGFITFDSDGDINFCNKKCYGDYLNDREKRVQNT